MTATKIVNYTESQEQEMAMVYGASDSDAERKEDVKQLAEKFGKSVQSIRAKLSKLDVYVKPAKVSKATGKVVVRKADMVQNLADIMGVNFEDVQSLEKATVTALESLISQFTHLATRISDLEKAE